MDKFECWLPSWDYLHNSCKKIVKKMEEKDYRPDIAVALSRGGYVPARIICDMMIIKDLVSIKVDHWGITAAKDGQVKIRYPLSSDLTGKKVLVVDDITDTGKSMIASKAYLKSLNPKDIKTATALHISSSEFEPDYFGEKIEWKWVIFPWNYMEDMCTLVPKVLEEKNSKNIDEIRNGLKENFKIDINGDSVLEILGKLEREKIVASYREGWLKVKP